MGRHRHPICSLGLLEFGLFGSIARQGRVLSPNRSHPSPVCCPAIYIHTRSSRGPQVLKPRNGTGTATRRPCYWRSMGACSQPGSFLRRAKTQSACYNVVRSCSCPIPSWPAHPARAPARHLLEVLADNALAGGGMLQSQSSREVSRTPRSFVCFPQFVALFASLIRRFKQLPLAY